MPAIPLPITTNFCLFIFSSMLCLLILVPMVLRGDADLHRRLARSIDDWGAPIGGQRIVDYDDQDLRVFKRRANTRPAFFRAQRTASADESLIVGHPRGA
jgi:hypothetical protein